MKPQDLPGSGEAVRAAADGAEAARAGKELPDCPYSAQGETFLERFRYRFWTRGFKDAEAGETPPSGQSTTRL
ncbi:hypothetical protein ACFQ0M_47990 [Kitasatospora aburaviensis]|uniref:Uncharacterized protein n=1 Tax=Kitasatospora aburaviensis TaxID=67265 RepID=A0ABW1F0L3_9ACTN